jgi:hypothetical protein
VENKWVKEKLEGIDFAMGVDQEGMCEPWIIAQ